MCAVLLLHVLEEIQTSASIEIVYWLVTNLETSFYERRVEQLFLIMAVK